MLARLFRKKSLHLIEQDASGGLGEGHGPTGLAKELTALDLTALGIAAIIGAGIFSTIGGAAAAGGPAVAFLFVFTAVACGFSALCYAEFASRIPVAGSAYTYAYASLGELIAWIIGWDLLMEYAIGNIAVAISWSDYFCALLAGLGVHVPEYLRTDLLTASRGADTVAGLVAGGLPFEKLRDMPEYAGAVLGHLAWTNAPRIGPLHLVCNLPALGITVLITALVYVGIRESKKVSNFMVGLKVAVVLLVICVGAFYVDPAHWSPFAPNGAGGVLKGVSGVFFAYIGFDAISTTAEECRDPKRDLPRGMFYSLIICTILYILVALVLTGMVDYRKLQVGDPLAFVFGPEGVNVPWINGVVTVSAVVAMATVLLVFQLGQPRIWMAMSRDGLLPKVFSKIHPRFRTPSFSTVLAGFVVAVPSLFMNLTEVTDLTSIGTLFAFLIVSGGVLVLEEAHAETGRFKMPYYDGRWLVPAVLAAVGAAVLVANPDGVRAFFSAEGAIGARVPLFVYLILAAVLTYYTFRRHLSAIPVFSLLTCGYLMTELGVTNWIRFIVWLVLGLGLYFTYGVRHSRLAKPAA